MAGNTVELIFAGDSTKLERSFSKVGASAKDVAGDLDKASGKARSFGGAMDSAGGAADASESKFMGAADLLDGLGGAFGLPTEGATNMMRSFGDLTGGFAALGPMFGQVMGKLGAMIGLTGAQAAATGTATGAQWSLNAALHANPIGAVVLAIGLLVGAFVLAWKHSETFRDVVKGALDVVKGAASGLWDFFSGLPGLLWGIADKIKDAILWPYKTAFNLVAKIWNSTVGKLSFEIPGWVPGMGGKGFSMPQLPTFHAGGTVPGARGSEVAIMAMAGETITPAGGGGVNLTVIVQGSVVTEAQLIDAIHSGLLRKQRRTPLGFAAA